MTGLASTRSRWLWLEYAMGAAVMLTLARAMWWLYSYYQLPQPFFYESNDTFMDWFNTAYWAHTSGAYDDWKTIYPPLSFVVLSVIGKQDCYINADSLSVRECDWIGIVAIHVIFVVNIFLIARTFLKIDRKTAIPRSIALAVGMPMLYALERGNILLLCFSFLILAFGPLVKSARVRWICAGIAINFKVYLIAAVAAQLLKRRWRWFEGAVIATIVVYLLSYGIFGQGTPYEIFRNIRDYSASFTAAQVLDVWYPVTYQPLIVLLEGQNFPVSNAIGSRLADISLMILPMIVRVGQLSIVIAAVCTWLRPEIVPNYRLAFFGCAMALISSEAGGYTQMMVLLFVFMEPWKGIARPIAILCAYLLSMPGDIGFEQIPPIWRDSYLAGRFTEVYFYVAVGMFLRPGLLILIAISLSFATIRDVWVDIRHQGWKDRWRYRRDWPLLPGIARPSPPALAKEPDQ
jgi:hypothetical protein